VVRSSSKEKFESPNSNNKRKQQTPKKMSKAMYMPTRMASSDDVGGMEFSQKQGHSCCGYCCNTRRAVIIVNLIMICFNLLTALSFIAGVELMDFTTSQADDDQVAAY
jgi:hypothetical protein